MDGVIDDVYDHRADIGVIYLTKLTEKIVCRLLDARELTFYELAAVPPCVYVRKGHPLHPAGARVGGGSGGLSCTVPLNRLKGVAVDFSEELPMVSMRKPSKAIIVNNRSTAMNVLANTDAYSTGSGLLAEHLSPANVVTIPLTDKDPVRLGWIYSAERQALLSRRRICPPSGTVYSAFHCIYLFPASSDRRQISTYK